MAVHATTRTEVTAEVDLWVPRDAMGDLESGVRAVVDDVDGVEDAAVTSVTDVTPRATDIRVSATVWLVVADLPPDAEAAETHLDDGFGVMDSRVLVVEPVE
jgi:hypothetical protein